MYTESPEASAFPLHPDHRYDCNLSLLEQAHSSDPQQAEQALDELVRLNAGLVRSLALRFRDRGTDLEDLIQIGMIGMMKAIRSFDASRGTTFSTYAVPLIVGELRRHFRDSGLIRIGRTYKKLGAALMSARNRIRMEEGREASVRELAECCGVPLEEAAVALDAITPVSSLFEPTSSDGDGLALEDRLADEEGTAQLERITDRIALGQAISRLPPLWRKIVLLRYYRDHTQQQTAEQLGLSQVKISREEKKILAFLREELTGTAHGA
jgi:RNA polymerase sporulation-specific sigma factor